MFGDDNLPLTSLISHDILQQQKKDPNQLWKILGLIFSILAVISAAIVGIYLLKKESDIDDEEESEEPNKKGLQFISWAEAHKKAREKLNIFTDEEKLSLLYGNKVAYYPFEFNKGYLKSEDIKYNNKGISN